MRVFCSPITPVPKVTRFPRDPTFLTSSDKLAVQARHGNLGKQEGILEVGRHAAPRWVLPLFFVKPSAACITRLGCYILTGTEVAAAGDKQWRRSAHRQRRRSLRESSWFTPGG